MVFFREPFQLLRNPGGNIPFGLQGYPIPDPLQVHAMSEQRKAVTAPYSASNRLPFGRFLGTNWTQIHQPEFLAANERIHFESGW